MYVPIARRRVTRITILDPADRLLPRMRRNLTVLLARFTSRRQPRLQLTATRERRGAVTDSASTSIPPAVGWARRLESAFSRGGQPLRVEPASVRQRSLSS